MRKHIKKWLKLYAIIIGISLAISLIVSLVVIGIFPGISGLFIASLVFIASFFVVFMIMNVLAYFGVGVHYFFNQKMEVQKEGDYSLDDSEEAGMRQTGEA